MTPAAMGEAQDPRDASTAGERPSLLREGQAGLELLALPFHPVYYGIGVPRGDGTPVLVLPGFLGDDSYLLTFRNWLARVGYRPYRSALGPVVGSLADLLARTLARTAAVAAASGARVTVIGHSLGGVLGRAVAGQRPDLVAHVVTLGSPRADARWAVHPLVATLADSLLGAPAREGDQAGAGAWARDLAPLTAPVPAEVRLTSICSPDDAVVPWPACEAVEPHAAAYAVRGSHLGLTWNAEVYRLVGRMLAEPSRLAGATDRPAHARSGTGRPPRGGHLPAAA